MKHFISNNQLLKGIVYKTDNIIIQKTQEGLRKKRCFIIGTGHSLSVNEEDYITKHDPFMHEFVPKVAEEVTVYVFYFTFESSGLEESSREIAEFVDSLQENYEQIFLVGHSKCGVCLTNTSWYCKKEVVLVTISTPFKGTIVADKEMTEKELKYPILIKIYNMIFSNHNVDKDIAPNSRCIKNMHYPICKEHINVVSTLRGLQDCNNPIDVFLVFWDKLLKIGGDGIVSIDSQMATTTNQEINVFCSHASSLTQALRIIDKIP